MRIETNAIQSLEALLWFGIAILVVSASRSDTMSMFIHSTLLRLRQKFPSMFTVEGKDNSKEEYFEVPKQLKRLKLSQMDTKALLKTWEKMSISNYASPPLPP